MDDTAPAWPRVVKVGTIDPDAERQAVKLTQLDAFEKQWVWACFKRSRPALVRLLRDDAGFAALRTAFPKADVIIPFAVIQGESTC